MTYMEFHDANFPSHRFSYALSGLLLLLIAGTARGFGVERLTVQYSPQGCPDVTVVETVEYEHCYTLK